MINSLNEFSNKLLDKHIGCVRTFLPLIQEEERVQIFNRIREGYCEHCGRTLESVDRFICHCTNDT